MPENEYDQILSVADGGQPAGGNEYDDLLAGADQSRKAKLQVALTAANQSNPDERARALNLALQARVPPDVAQRNLGTVEDMARRKAVDYDAIIKDMPGFADWLSNHDNATLSKDDVAHLQELAWQTSGRDYFGPPRSDRDAVAIAREDAIRDGSLVDYVKTLPVIRNVLSVASGIPQGVKDIGSSVAYAGSLAGVPGATEVENTLAQEATDLGKQSDLASSGFEHGVNVVGQAVSRVVTNVAVPGGVVKGLRYLGMAPRVAGYLGHGGYAALQGATQADIQADESNLTGWKKAAYVMEHAATEAGFTTLFGLHGTEMVGQPLKAYVTDTFRRYLGYTGHAAGEALEENATNLTHDFIDWMQLPENEKVTIGEMFTDWLRSVPETTAVAGIVGGGIPAISANSYRIREARNNEDYFKALATGVTDSKTFQRMPAAMQSMLEAATKNGPVENVYAQSEVWDQYWESQGVDPRKIAEEVTGDVAAYDHAVETGGNIAIPTARYAVKLANTDHNAFFARELKRSPDGMSAREAEEFVEEAKRVAAEAPKLQAEPTQVDDEVLADATEQLIAAGYSPQSAEDSAAPLGFFNVLANRWNKDAEARGAKPIDAVELFQSYGLKIQREGAQTSEPAAVQEAAQEFGQERVPASGAILNRVQSLLLRRQAHRDSQGAEPVDKQAATEKIVRQPTELSQTLNESGKGKDAGRRGFIRIAENRKVTITLGEKADPSTVLHEFYHFGLEVLGDLAEREGAPQDIKDDWKSVLDWLGVKSRTEIKTEHHEQWARAGEVYWMEGKSPSSALRRVFARLSEWIKEVYKGLKTLGVNLTPEVRGVMDRMLASEEAIAEAEREEVGSPLFLDAKTAGMTDERFEAYAKGIEKVALTARENLRVEILDELKRNERTWYKAERQRITEDVTREVNERKEYAALAMLQKGKLPDGAPLPEGATPIKFDKKLLVKDFGEDITKKLPRSYTTQDGYGTSPEAAASFFGYRDQFEMIEALTSAKPKADAIHDEVEARLLKEHGDMRFDGTASAKAEEALHGEASAEVLHLELRALHDLQRKAKPIVKEAVDVARAGEKQKQETKADERVADARLAGQIDSMKLAARLDIAKQQSLLEKEKLKLERGIRNDIAKGQVRAEKQKAKDDRAVARIVPQGIPPLEIFKEAAVNTIAKMAPRDIDAKAYLRATRKASKEAFAAFSKKDYVNAGRLKHREILNNALFVEASKATAHIEKMVKNMRRFRQEGTRARIGKAGGDYLDIIDGLNAQYSFDTFSQPKLDLHARMSKFVNKILSEGRPHAMSQEVIDQAQQIPYQQVPYEFLVQIHDTAKNIQHLATTKNKLLKNEVDEDFDVVIGNTVSSINNNLPPVKPTEGESEQNWFSRRYAKVQGFIAAHRKLSSYARQADGGKAGGPLWDLLVYPLNVAADEEVEYRKKAAKAQNALWKVWQSEGKSLGDRVNVPGVGNLRLETRLVVALNYGNEGNRDRLRNEYNDQQQRAIIDTLDGADWALVKGIAEHIESFWPEIAAKAKRLNGLPPEKVDAVPFQTKFGEMPGWYYPIAYDPNRSAKALGNVDQSEEVDNLYKIGHATTRTTKRGHEEHRTGNPGVKLRMSLNVIPQHLSQVIHDLTHHEAIIDANKVVLDERLSTAIQERLGPFALREMRKIVKDIAVSDLAENAVDRNLRYVRNGVSVATLGFNLGTVAMQVTGIGQSMQLVGVMPFLRAVRSIAGDATKAQSRMEWIRNKSRFMRDRVDTSIRESAEVINQVKSGGWREGVNHWAYYLMQRAQQLVDMPTWLAAYETAQQDGHDEPKAVAIADQAVKDSQGSGLTVDLAGVQRSRVTQLLTVFYSYFNTTFNRSAESVARFKNAPKTPGSVLQLASDFVLLYSLPAAMSVLIRQALKGDDEKDKSLLVEMGKEHIGMLMAPVIGLRELSGAVSNSYGYRGPAGAMGFDAISNLIIQSKQGEFDQAFADAALRAIGVWGHLPTSTATRLIDGFLYNEDRQSSDPRPLLFGPPPHH
jgi:hypothetical protein